MKKLSYFKVGEPIPEGATFLCFKKVLVGVTSVADEHPFWPKAPVPVYDDILVYEVPVDGEWKLEEAK